MRAAGALVTAIGEQRAAGAVIFASHDLHRVRELADVVAFLVSGRLIGLVETMQLTVVGLQERYADVLARRAATP